MYLKCKREYMNLQKYLELQPTHGGSRPAHYPYVLIVYAWNAETSCNLIYLSQAIYNAQKNTIHQLNTILSTSKNVLFSGNHLLTISADDLML